MNPSALIQRRNKIFRKVAVRTGTGISGPLLDSKGEAQAALKLLASNLIKSDG